MSVSDLIPELLKLDRADKLRLLQLLALDLAKDEQSLLTEGASYPVWSPYGAHDAARTLLEALNGEAEARHG